VASRSGRHASMPDIRPGLPRRSSRPRVRCRRVRQKPTPRRSAGKARLPAAREKRLAIRPADSCEARLRARASRRKRGLASSPSSPPARSPSRRARARTLGGTRRHGAGLPGSVPGGSLAGLPGIAASPPRERKRAREKGNFIAMKNVPGGLSRKNLQVKQLDRVDFPAGESALPRVSGPQNAKCASKTVDLAERAEVISEHRATRYGPLAPSPMAGSPDPGGL
jgi:hypothetical protein